MRSLWFFVASAVVSAAQVAGATVYYADAGRPDDAGNGLTWGTAKKTIQAGINVAASNDQVWVKAGTYAETITLKTGVAVYGGFAGGETLLSQRDFLGNITTIDATTVAAPNHVVTMNATTTARIDGFTITGGNANGAAVPLNCGGGMYCTNANNTNTVANCIIIANTAHGPNGTSASDGGKVAYGGGVYCASSSPAFTSCTITNNTAIGGNGFYVTYYQASSGANAWGGAVYASASSSAFTDCLITLNTAQGGNAQEANTGDAYGGGLYFTTSSPVFLRTNVQSNTAKSGAYTGGSLHGGPGSAYGGGLYCAASTTLRYTNGTITANNAWVGDAGNGYRDTYGSGGGIYSDASTLVMDIATISNNVARGPGSGYLYGTNSSFGGGVCSVNNGLSTFTNCSLNGNTASATNTQFSGSYGRGGGCYCANAVTVTFADSSISGNSGTGQYGNSNGGGIYCYACSPNLARCTLDGNTISTTGDSSGWPLGGGICLDNCTIASLTDCILTNNKSQGIRGSRGGGFFCNAGSPTLTRCTVDANIVNTGWQGYDGGYGGGVCFTGCLSAKLDTCYVRTNQALGNDTSNGGRGAGIYSETTTLQLTNCTVESNTAGSSQSRSTGYGGGMYVVNNPSLTVTDCSFTSNTVSNGMAYPGRGGGVYLSGCASATFSNTPIRQNQAFSRDSDAGCGGGIYAESSSPQFSNCAVESNIAGQSTYMTSGRGGGIYMTGCVSPTFTNCPIRSNQVFAGDHNTSYGGGIYSESSSPQFTSCAIELNITGSGQYSAGGYGGGVYCSGTRSPQLSLCIIRYNTVSSSNDYSTVVGGGIYCNGCSPTLDQCQIDNNLVALTTGMGHGVTVAGGGMYCDNGAAPILTRCTVNANRALISTSDPYNNQLKGGGICSNGASPTLDRCSVCSNMAAGPVASMTHSSLKSLGGGICCEGGSPSITRCVISGNQVKGGGMSGNHDGYGDSALGGAIYCGSACAATVINCVLTGNKAIGGKGYSNYSSSYKAGDATGGALHCDASSPIIVNCTLASNELTAGLGGGVVANGTAKGGAICCVNNSDPVIKNVVIENCPGGALYEASTDSDPIVTYCLFGNNPNGDYFDENAMILTGAAAINAIPDGQAANNVEGSPMFAMFGSGAIVGTWTAAPVYDSAANMTTLTDSAASYATNVLAGRLVNPDTSQRTQALVVSNTATQLVVVGDVTSFATSGKTYRIVDCRLGAGSRAVDTGTGGANVPSVDMDGNVRPFDNPGYLPDGTGTEYDIGAYESVVDLIPVVYAVTCFDPNPTPATSVRFLVTFAEVVTGVDLSDLALSFSGLSGTAITGLSGTGATRIVTVDTGTGEGTIRLDVLDDDSIKDISLNPLGGIGTGNGNFTSGQVYTIDRTSPTATLASTAPSFTRISPIPVTVTFSEPVIGFTVDDIVATNATAANFSGSGASYSLNLVPAGQGLVTAQINAGMCTDLAGNPNMAVAPLSRTYDTVAPVPTMSSTAPDPTNTTPIPVTVVFPEPVTGFTSTDVSSTNATVSNFNGSGANYSFNLVPSVQGTITARINANVCTDLAGNNNTAATPFTRVYDSVPPTVSMTSTAPDPTNASPIAVTVTFSESVSDFAAEDISPTNGQVANFAGSGKSYTFDLVPIDQGSVSAAINAGVAHDAANNGNTAAIALSRVYDTMQPTVSINSVAPNPTNMALIPVTVSFSEVITDFAAEDIIPANGVVANFGGSGKDYSFDLVPAGQGEVSASIGAGTAHDAAGNATTDGAFLARTYDTIPPTVEMTSVAPEPTNTSPILVTVTFSEPVADFDALDIITANGSVYSLGGTGDQYTFELIPAGQGVVSVTIGAGTVHDTAGNPNTSGAFLSREYDSNRPTVSITSSASNPTNTSPIPVTVTFSKSVTGFESGDIVVTNGIVEDFGGTGATYTFVLVPSDQGEITATIPENTAHDIASNGNTIGHFTHIYDTVRPGLTIVSAASNQTNASPIPITVTFTEPVSGFDAADLVVTNADVQNFSGTGAQYDFELVPTSQGDVTVNVAGGVAQDAAGNDNTASALLTRTYDTIPPSVSMDSATPDPTNSQTIAVTVTFSEPVNDFDAGDIVAENAQVHNFSGSDTSYAFVLVPSDQGLVTASIGADTAHDAASNGNTPGAFSRTFDSVGPTPVITGDDSLTNTLKTLTIDFGEVVHGFELANVSVVNGTAIGLRPSGASATYAVDVLGAGDVAVSVSIPAAVATDNAGNPSNPTTVAFTFPFDNVRPTPLITGSTTLTNATRMLTIDFCEVVNGFVLGIVSVGNGTASNLQPAGPASSYTVDVLGSGTATVSVSVDGSVVTDNAGNPNNSTGEPFTYPFDNVAPTPMISGATTLTNTTRTLTIDFGEMVNGFTLDKVSVGNGTVSNLQPAGPASSYTVDVLGAGVVTVAVSIGGAAATDNAGNANNPTAAPFTYPFDDTPPVVTVGTPPYPNVTNNVLPLLTGTASDSIGVAGVNVTINGKTYAAQLPGDNSWNVQLPAGDELVGVPPTTYDVTAVATDLIGNVGTDATSGEIEVDTTAPTTVEGVLLDSATPTRADIVGFRVVFSLAVNTVVADDFAIVSGTGVTGAAIVAVVQDTLDPKEWRVFVNTGAGDGTLGLDVTDVDHTLLDIYGHPVTVPFTMGQTYAVDKTRPTPYITGATTLTNTTRTVTIDFGEVVHGFVLGVVSVTNGTASNLQPAGPASTYTIDVLGSGAVSVAVSIEGDIVIDNVGNPNNPTAAPFTYPFDGVAPTASVALDDPSPTGADAISFSVDFSEPLLIPLSASDVSLTPGSLAGGIAISDTDPDYTVTVTLSDPNAEGTVGITIPYGAVSDLAGNSYSGNTSPLYTIQNATLPVAALAGLTGLIGLIAITGARKMRKK